MANNSQPLIAMIEETLDRTSNTMNTPIPCRSVVASSRLPLHHVHRILAAGLSALLALSIQVASTAHADPPPATLTRIHSFGDPLKLAVNPSGPVIEGSDRALYGTTTGGGSFGAGTLFRVNKDGTAFTVVKSFNSATDGGVPQTGVTEGSDGAIYGTTSQGGTFGAGTVFRVNKNGSSFAVLKSFNSATDGGDLQASVIEGSDGTLYVTASQGGTNGFGTIFRMKKDGSEFAVLKSFDNLTDGANPTAGMIEGSDGALYGTASQGGTYGAGTVFRVNKDGSGFAVLKSFEYYSDGANPRAGLIEGSDGVLYGTAYQGGNMYAGTVFRLNKDGSEFSVLKSFNYDADYTFLGGYLYGGVTEGSDGALYGTTSVGGEVQCTAAGWCSG